MAETPLNNGLPEPTRGRTEIRYSMERPVSISTKSRTESQPEKNRLIVLSFQMSQITNATNITTYHYIFHQLLRKWFSASNNSSNRASKCSSNCASRHSSWFLATGELLSGSTYARRIDFPPEIFMGLPSKCDLGKKYINGGPHIKSSSKWEKDDRY